MMHSINCTVCRAKDYDIYLKSTLDGDYPVFGYKWTPEVRKSYQMVKCKECGHVRASPIHADIYKSYVDNIDDEYLNNSELRTATSEVVLKKIKKFKAKGKLLDVGCATGDFLKVASRDFSVQGIELSSWARKECIKKKLDVKPLLIEDLSPKKNNSYDVITLWGVIEHLEEPLKELETINKLLKEDGIICLWTGDVDSIFAKIFKDKWWYVMGQHIQLFSRSSLDLALRKNNFERVFSGIYPYIMSLGYLGRNLKRYPLISKFISPILESKFFANIKIPLYLSDEIFYIYRKKK